MQRYSRAFTLSALSLALLSHYSVASNDSELNLNFLQGVNTTPSVLASGSRYPAGQYYVDVIVNQENLGKTTLTISPDEDKNDALCLSVDWMKDINMPVRLKGYEDAFDTARQCYVLSKNPYTKVDFRYGTQTLVFSIPQSLTLSKTDPARWDYGVAAARLRYDANVARTSRQGTAAYASGTLLLNAGRWVLNSNMSGSRGSDGSTDFAVRDATLSTSISQVKGDLLLGKAWTRSELFSDFGFYGVSLRSNSAMDTWETRGYAPVISGVATTASRITVTQNGYTIYSKSVPPGPYKLEDIRSVGNGDLEVTVEDENGRRTVTTYPVTVLPTLLRPGELEYNVSVGRKSGNSKLNDPFADGEKGLFWMGSLGYGLGSTTLNAASILHDKYQAGGGGVTWTLGMLGAFSVSGNLSQAKYDSGEQRRGHSISAKYAKSFSSSSNLQLLAYRYQSRGYTEFADFFSTDRYARNSKKSRYEMQLSQRLWGNNSLSLSGWKEDYWWQSGTGAGGSLGVSTSVFGDTFVNLSGNYSKQPYSDKPDYSVSLGVSIPFTAGGIRYSTYTGMNHSRSGGSSMNNSLSASPTDRLNYGLSTNLGEKGNRSVSGNVGYSFDAIQTNASVSQSRDTTTVSGSISGTLLATAGSGLLMTRDSSDTVGVVRIPNVPGVRVNGSPETDHKGYTVVGLSNYTVNSVSVDMDNVPDSLELATTSYSVVPTEKAVVYREFSAEHVLRYILQVRDRHGQIIRGGATRTEQGLDAGFIAGNGVLLMNMLSPPSQVTVSQDDGTTCSFSMKGIEAGTGKVQEVRCE